MVVFTNYKHAEWLTLSELEAFAKEHPEVWGKSEMLFHSENGIVIPTRNGCDLCPWCEGEQSYNCQNLLYEIDY